MVTVSTRLDVFSWDLGIMILGWSHTCDLKRLGVKGHLGVNDFWFKVLKKGHCIHMLWCIFMRLGHNDPWVVSHIWPQHTWGQRSSRGQWPLVQVLVWGQIWYYNDCKSMWSRKQARLVVRELPYGWLVLPIFGSSKPPPFIKGARQIVFKLCIIVM